jgi:hypothetical protein
MPSTPELLSALRRSFAPTPPPLSLVQAPASAGNIGNVANLPHDAAAAPRLPCLFDKLATVELQLVLQFLDGPGKIAAGCSCKRLLTDAADPFAWRAHPPTSVPPLLVRVSGEDMNNLASELHRLADHVAQGRLLRRRPVHLALLRTAEQHRRNRALDVPARSITSFADRLASLYAPFLWRPKLWTSLLNQGPHVVRLRNLTDLHGGLFTEQQMGMIAQLPQVRRLCISVSAHSLHPLSLSSSLTSLSLNCEARKLDPDDGDQDSAVQVLLRALRRAGGEGGPPLPSNLTRLEISTVRFPAPEQAPDADFAGFCATPLLSQLTSLRLHYVTYAGRVSLPHLASLEAGLPLLSRLHTLELSYDVLTDEVLAVFATHAPASLRRLLLLYLPPESPYTYQDHFSRECALRLHEAKPRLLLHLVVPRSFEDWIAKTKESVQQDRAVTRGAIEETKSGGMAWQFDYLAEHLRTLDIPSPLPNIRRHELSALKKPLCWCTSPLRLREHE